MSLSPQAQHIASQSRISLTEYERWEAAALAFYDNAKKGFSVSRDVQFFTVQGDIMALWHNEYQMGYIVLPQ